MSSLARRAIILGPLIAVTPLSIDLYLPALPEIGTALGVPTSVVQLSLVAYMLAMTAGPLLWGPLSDRIGRRPAMTVGLSIYTVAAIGLIFAPSIEWLIALRFAQGFGGSSTQVCARASVRDSYSGIEAARLMSLMMLVLGISPILAPLIGALLLAVLPWRFIFAVFAVLGVAALLIVRLPFRESLPVERRNTAPLVAMLVPLGQLFLDRSFLAIALVGAFAHAGFFTYLVNSSSVLMDGYGLTSVAFGLTFGINAFAMIAGTQINVWLLPRFGPLAIARAAAALYALSALGMTLVALLLPADLIVLQVLLCICIGCLGFINANTTVIALESQPHRAGSAAAAISLAQIGFGVVGASLAGLFGNGSALAMSVVIAAFAVSGVVMSRMVHSPSKV